MSERSGVCEQSEQVSGTSKQVSGASEQANGQASGPVLQSLFVVVLEHVIRIVTRKKRSSPFDRDNFFACTAHFLAQPYKKGEKLTWPIGIASRV